MSRILLVDIDSKIPNLALMKLSAYHKARGDQVYLNACSNPDLTYASCIFSWNRGKVLLHPEAKVGGSGVSLETELPPEIEHIMPDYSLYGCDYSMGFTSRGCIRQCGFCIVPKKEGGIRTHAPLSEFLHPNHRKVMLLDNNLLAAPRCKDILTELAERKLLVNFNQGLDIRLVTDENARLLAACNYRSMSFKEKRLYFAFDDPKIEPAVRRGVERLEGAGVKPRNLMFYVLVGYPYNMCPSRTWYAQSDHDETWQRAADERGVAPPLLERGSSPKGNCGYEGTSPNYDRELDARMEHSEEEEGESLGLRIPKWQDQTDPPQRSVVATLERRKGTAKGLLLHPQAGSSESNKSGVCSGICSELGENVGENLARWMDGSPYQRYQDRQHGGQPSSYAKKEAQYVALCPSPPTTDKGLGGQCGECNECLLNALHRIEVIRSLGADPFVMKYNNRQDATLNALARWVNKRICERIPFSEYTRRKELVTA